MRAPVSRWVLAVAVVACLVVVYVSVFRLMGKYPWPFDEKHEPLVQTLRGFALIVALLCSLRISRASEAAAGAPAEPPKITVSPTGCYSCGKELAENERAARVCRACSA